METWMPIKNLYIKSAGAENDIKCQNDLRTFDNHKMSQYFQEKGPYPSQAGCTSAGVSSENAVRG